MRVLLDHSVRTSLLQHLPEHQVIEAASIGWERWRNGQLLIAAEPVGPAIGPYVGRVRDAVNAAQASSFVEVAIPFPFPKGDREN